MTIITDGWQSALIALERSLLRPEVRSEGVAVAALLADDFFEIGASGKRYDRAQILAAFAEAPSIKTEASDFEVALIAPGLARVSYVSRLCAQAGAATVRRTSLWRQADGQWQMVFHQGTPTCESDSSSHPA